jgi:hypothetical protein
MPDPFPDEIGGLVVCRKCQHMGQYLKADVRNAEAERRLRDRLACSRCGCREFTLVPRDGGGPEEVMRCM